MEADLSKLTLIERFLLCLSANGVSVRLKRKRDSVLMTILGKILFFNRSFMSRYYTTIGRTLYTPDHCFDYDSPYSIDIVAHEAVHVAMSKKYPILFGLIYLFPQCLALLALLAFLPFQGSLWFLLALLFLLPWPAPGRTVLEKWGYLMSLIVNEWQTGRSSDFEIEFVLDQFSGSEYYWMRLGGRKKLHAWFERELASLRSCIFPLPLFRVVFEFMKQERLVHHTITGRPT